MKVEKGSLKKSPNTEYRGLFVCDQYVRVFLELKPTVTLFDYFLIIRIVFLFDLI